MRILFVALLVTSLNAFGQEAAESNATAEKNGWRAHVFYSMADSITQDGKISGTVGATPFSGSFDQTVKAEAGFGVAVEKAFKMNKFDLVTGVSYDFERKEKSYSGNILGVPVAGVATDPDKWSILDFYVNGELKITPDIYGLLGVNFPIINYKSSGSASMRGVLGYQIGVGYMANENIAIELSQRVINFTGEANSVSGTTTAKSTVDTGSEQGPVVGAKYFF